jgi:soluble P-type ATPase
LGVDALGADGETNDERHAAGAAMSGFSLAASGHRRDRDCARFACGGGLPGAARRSWPGVALGACGYAAGRGSTNALTVIGGLLMLHVSVPRGDDLRLEQLLLDVNGTLTDRGELIEGVPERLSGLHGRLVLHLLSADTFGTAGVVARALGAEFRPIRSGEDKRRYLESLGAQTCVAIGNGANDRAMLEAAALGVAVVGPEGAHATALQAADVVVSSINDALDLLAHPQALTATLRP